MTVSLNVIAIVIIMFCRDGDLLPIGQSPMILIKLVTEPVIKIQAVIVEITELVRVIAMHVETRIHGLLSGMQHSICELVAFDGRV